MRAFLSADRGGNGEGTMLAHTRADEAIREASAILAQVEPDTARTYHSSPRKAQRLHGGALVRSILAESLAAFIGETR